jgi:hypothetical protein
VSPEIKVESGIPIPSGSGGRPNRYPFPDMEVGESFFTQGIKAGIRARTAAAAYQRRHPPVTFRTAIEVIDYKQGIRIWRTA